MKRVIIITVSLMMLVSYGIFSFGQPTIEKGDYSKNSVVSYLIPIQNIFMQGNNINTVFRTDGIMNCDWVNFFDHSAGLIWPVSAPQRQTLDYTSGIWVGAKVLMPGNQKELRFSAAAYNSHYSPGNIPIIGGVPPTSVCSDPKWRGYYVQLTDRSLVNGGVRVKTAGGRQYTFNYDAWSQWPVQLGAPYVERNGIPGYQPGWLSDRPGIGHGSYSRPDELLFMVYMDYTNCTDSIHRADTTVPGGSKPLGVEIQQLIFIYSSPGFTNAYLFKTKVINRSAYNWDSTYISYYDDINIGYPYDDAAGCDTANDMAFGYNGDNNDPIYGANPPASGYRLLQGPLNYTGNMFDTAFLPYDTLIGYRVLDLRAFSVFTNTAADSCFRFPRLCQSAYYYMQGMDGCGRYIMHPHSDLPTPFMFEGNFCNQYGGGDSTIGERQFLQSSGPLRINSNDTQVVVFAGLVTRSSNNFQSVCQMLFESRKIQRFYSDNFDYSISGRVRYRDNNQGVDSGYVKSLKYDFATGNIIPLDSVPISPGGYYELLNVGGDSVYIMAYQNSEEDFIPTYYVSTIDWRNATVVRADSNVTGIDVLVYRITPGNGERNTIGGRVMDINGIGLTDAIVYAKQGNYFRNYGISFQGGHYVLNDLLPGTYEIIVNRIGYCGASTTVTLGLNNIDTLNFRLCQVLIGIEKNGEIIPARFELHQNYPNPFNPSTRIKFDLPVNSNVSLVIYDLLGREVAKLIDNEFKQAGSYSVLMDAWGFSSGVYFYRIEAGSATGDFILTKKMVVVK